MYHSIFFGNENAWKNTWDDWHLIPSSRPVVNPPSPKTTYIDVPGSDGQIDMTESLTGEVAYNSRSGSFQFIVDNGHEEWFELYSRISEYLHGRKMKVILEDDLNYYYEGRLSVNKWQSGASNSSITIDYALSSYKYERFSSVEDWEWDSFNFETGIIRDYRDISISGKTTITIVGRRKSAIPGITVKAKNPGEIITVTFNGVTYELNEGYNKIPPTYIKNDTDNTYSYAPGIVFREGDNTLIFSGEGTITIDYRGGRL